MQNEPKLAPMTAAAANRVIEQALSLPKSKKKALLGRLWKDLEPMRVQSPTLHEIERRVKSVREGTATTYGMEEIERALDRAKQTALKRRQKARPSQ
jgi:hypothetical protein